MKTVLLIPVKDAANAKQRMSPLLTAVERAQLAWIMFDGLAEAVRATFPPQQVHIVTNSARAADSARTLGWGVIWERDQISESHSVDRASRQLAAEGAEAVLRLPADLPLIRTEDLEWLRELPATSKGAVLVPSWDWRGTNAVLRCPPDLFPSRFGHNSLVLHTQEALRSGTNLRILENARIACDLDDESDLRRLLESDNRSRSAEFLRKIQVESRIAAHAR